MLQRSFIAFVGKTLTFLQIIKKTLKFQGSYGAANGTCSYASHPPSCTGSFSLLGPLLTRQSTGLSRLTVAPVGLKSHTNYEIEKRQITMLSAFFHGAANGT